MQSGGFADVQVFRSIVFRTGARCIHSLDGPKWVGRVLPCRDDSFRQPASQIITPACSIFSKPPFDIVAAAAAATAAAATAASASAAPAKRAVPSDAEAKQRGKRMMGILVGTLSRIQSDSSQISTKDQRRIELEDKLAAKLAEEKTLMAAQLAAEQEERRQRVEEVRKQREERLMNLWTEKWRMQKIQEAGFLMTETKPCLAWLPAETDEETHLKIQTQIKKAESAYPLALQDAKPEGSKSMESIEFEEQQDESG